MQCQFALRNRSVADKLIDFDCPDRLVIKGEAYIAPVDLELDQKNEGPLTKTRRVFVSAIMHDGAEEAFSRRFRFFAYDCINSLIAAMKTSNLV